MKRDKKLVSIDTGKLLNDIGYHELTKYDYVEYLEDDSFDDPRSGDLIVFSKKGDIKCENSYLEKSFTSARTKDICKAPYLYKLQDWLRGEHGVCVYVDWWNHEGVIVDFKYQEDYEVYRDQAAYLGNDYEEQLDTLLFKALRYLKTVINNE